MVDDGSLIAVKSMREKVDVFLAPELVQPGRLVKL